MIAAISTCTRARRSPRSSRSRASSISACRRCSATSPPIRTTRCRGGRPGGGAAEILFWSEDVLPHLRPILTVTHLVVYTPPELPSMTLVAAKQLYAKHYFEAAVDLTSAIDRGTGI